MRRSTKIRCRFCVGALASRQRDVSATRRVTVVGIVPTICQDGARDSWSRAVQKVEKMSVAVTPELAGAVRAAVESGEYASTSEVIREAPRLWKSHQAARAREVEELRRAWQEGIESGPAMTLDFTEVKAKARAGLAKGRNRTR